MNTTTNPFDTIRIVPKYSEIISRSKVDIRQCLTKYNSDKIIFDCDSPLIPANMDSISGIEMLEYCNANSYIAFTHRYCTTEEINNILNKFSKFNTIGISIGVSKEDLNKYNTFINTFDRLAPQIVCIDIAHGHCKLMKDTLSYIKSSKLYNNIIVVAGNVCTLEGAQDLLEWGADYVKIGIGPGSVCKTTEYTGVGLPQASVINDLMLVIDDSILNRLIFDGGFKSYGDMCKALSVSSLVMSGSVFAGTDMCPGWPGNHNTIGEPMPYRGMASMESKSINNKDLCFIEGESKKVLSKEAGSTNKIYKDFSEALKSAMSYSNSLDLNTYRIRCELRFI